MIIINAAISNTKIHEEIQLAFQKYMENIKEKKWLLLSKKITELLSKATEESMKKRQAPEYITFIEESSLEKNRKKLESSIEYYFDEINVFLKVILFKE